MSGTRGISAKEGGAGTATPGGDALLRNAIDEVRPRLPSEPEQGRTDLVSVIVPVYNTANYLQRCLSSIELQSHGHLEVIVIDDGSTDGSTAICEEFMARDSRFRYLRQENQGVSTARNMGLHIASGAYIAFVDSDDWIEPRLFEDVLAAFAQLKVDAVFFEYFVDYPDASIRHRETAFGYGLCGQRAAVRLELGSQNSFAVTKVFRREVVGETRFNPHLHWGEECVFILEVLQKVARVCYLPDAFYHYVQSNGSATRQGFNARRLSGIDTAEEMLRLAKAFDPDFLPLARAFKGRILTDLLLEGAHEHPAGITNVRTLKTQLALVLINTAFSRDINYKQKAQWLIALINVRLLRRIRNRTRHIFEQARRGGISNS